MYGITALTLWLRCTIKRYLTSDLCRPHQLLGWDEQRRELRFFFSKGDGAFFSLRAVHFDEFDDGLCVFLVSFVIDFEQERVINVFRPPKVGG